MIAYPENWKEIGQVASLAKIEEALLGVLSSINCHSIALSGGIDSGLLLYFMSKIHDTIHAFTIGLSDLHPDVVYSKMVVSLFPPVEHHVFIPDPIPADIPEEFKGDNAVRCLYEFIGKYTDSVVAGDGVDEYNCGYYGHQKDLGEKSYCGFLRKLRDEQLIPLDENSGTLNIYLPYLSRELRLLFSEIPISEKVDKFHRKKIIQRLARGKLPEGIINRRKYGFCDAFVIKENKNES